MKPEKLRQKLQEDGVPIDMIDVCLSTYSYLNSHEAVYAWQISDGLFGQPSMGWSTRRNMTESALEILEHNNLVKKIGKTAQYKLR